MSIEAKDQCKVGKETRGTQQKHREAHLKSDKGKDTLFDFAILYCSMLLITFEYNIIDMSSPSWRIHLFVIDELLA